MAHKDIRTVVLALCLYIACVRTQPVSSIASIIPTAPCFASRSTWYADNQHGACSYGPSLGETGNGNMYVAATSKLVWGDSVDCGACYEITGPKGTVVVTVVDQCTDGGVCDTTFPHIDISPEAFDVIGDRTIAGVTSTSARRIACPVTGNVKLAVGSQYFYATNWEILIFNTKFPIRKVTATFSGTTYTLVRQTYNYWLYNGPAVTWPVTIAVTDVNGAVVTFSALTLKSGLITDAGAQFPAPVAIDSMRQCSAPLTVNTDGWIYNDALTMQYTDINYINVFSWLDWSYSSTLNWASTTAPYSGTNCIQATIAGYGAIQIGRSYNFAWSGLFSSIQFAVRGATAYTGVTVGFKTGGSIPIAITTSWQLITLSLSSDLKAPAIVGGTAIPLAFMNTKATSTPTLYLDSIRLIPADSSSSTTAPTTTTTQAAPSAAATSRPTSAPTSAAQTTTTTTKAPSTTTTTKAPSTITTTKAPTVTTTTTTKAPVTTTSTTRPPATPTTKPPAQSSGCAVSLNQVFIRSWTSGGTTYSQWSVTVTNGPTPIKSLTMSTTSVMSQFWTATQSSTGFGLPTYLADKGLPAGGSFEWGFIAAGTTQLPFTVTCS